MPLPGAPPLTEDNERQSSCSATKSLIIAAGYRTNQTTIVARDQAEAVEVAFGGRHGHLLTGELQGLADAWVQRHTTLVAIKKIKAAPPVLGLQTITVLVAAQQRREKQRSSNTLHHLCGGQCAYGLSLHPRGAKRLRRDSRW